MTHHVQIELIKEGTTLYTLDRNGKSVSGKVFSNIVLIKGTEISIYNNINIGTDTHLNLFMANDKKCFFNFEDLINSLEHGKLI